jgi:peptide/nickel transport system permease protein
MAWYVARRLGAAAVLLVLVPSLSFVFFTVSYTGGPVLPQLGDYLSATFLHLDLGQAGRIGSPEVGDLLKEGIAVDVALLAGGFGLGIGGGMLAGAAIAKRPRSLLARALNVVGALGLAMPVYLLGLVVVVMFGSSGGNHSIPFVTDQGQYQPLTRDFWAWLHSLWVPWVVVALPVGAAVMRLTSGATRDALLEDPVRTARAKGVDEQRVLRRHALPFSVPAVSAYSGASMNIMILNVAVMESAFNLPGSFRYASEAIDDVDFVLIQGLVLVAVIYVVVANLIADLVLARVDPRAR